MHYQNQRVGLSWRRWTECWASNINICRNTWSTSIAHPFLLDLQKYLVTYSLPSGDVYINRIIYFTFPILCAPWSKARLLLIGDVACVRHRTFIHKDQDIYPEIKRIQRSSLLRHIESPGDTLVCVNSSGSGEG